VSRLAALFALLLGLAQGPLQAMPASDALEQRFLAVREAGDRIRTGEAAGQSHIDERARYTADAAALRSALQAAQGPAARRMRTAFAEGDLDLPLPAVAPEAAPADCDSPFAADASLSAMRARTYACYSHAATTIRVEGGVSDRLSLLREIALAEDPVRREALFRAMRPMFRTVNGDGGPESPFRRMQALVAAEWRAGRSPVDANLRSLGLDPGLLEGWLLQILEAWGALTMGKELAPWDYEYAGNPVERRLGRYVALTDLRRINDGFHASLGADPVRLGIRYDIERRPGKTAVAFTDFGARPKRLADGRWSTGAPSVFAGYASGGIGNLNELLHETGHAIHIAAIRTSPAWADWPDSNAFTEALAEIFSLEVFEADWQQRWLGRSAPLEENLRSRYAGIALDVAWSLFELRVYADPAADPDAVWNEIAARYLHVRPEPGLSWWARRGQLVESPGYMLNYGLGAILAADMRQRARELRGSPGGPDAAYYEWIAERLFRFGRERSSADVLKDFLGRQPDPRALLADIGRGGIRASSPAPLPRSPATP
jgi:hypothetical protein